MPHIFLCSRLADSCGGHLPNDLHMCGSYIGFTLLCDSGCLVESASIILLQAVTPIAAELHYLDEFMRTAMLQKSSDTEGFYAIDFSTTLLPFCA